MVGNKTTPKRTSPARLSETPTYTIGGRKYNSQETSHLSTHNFHSQGESYRPSVNTQATVQSSSMNRTPEAVEDIKTNVTRMAGTSNLTTENIRYGTNVARVSTFTGETKYNISTNTAINLQQGNFEMQASGSVAGTKMLTVNGIGIESVQKIGNGVYQVSTTAGDQNIIVGRSAKTLVDRQTLSISKEGALTLHLQSAEELNSSIINKASYVKNAYRDSIAAIRPGGNKIQTGVDKSIKIVHGISNESLTVNMAKPNLQELRKRALRGIKTGVNTSVKTADKITKVASSGITKGTRFLKGGVMTASVAMINSNDSTVQGVGKSLIAANIGVKTGVKGAKTTGYTVKTSVKGGKAVYEGVKFIKNEGLKRAWDNARRKAAQKLLQSGESLVSLLIAGGKRIGEKAIVPLLIICVIVTALMGGISTPVMAVGSIFSNVFGTSDTKTEYDVREYVSARVPTLMTNLTNDVARQMQESRNSYHIVRFYSNTGNTDAAIIGGQGELIGQFRITAYCGCYECSEGYGNTTSTGTIAQQGRTIAVDPAVIPYGTKVYFNNHVYVAEDCGGAINGNDIDLYFNSHQDALNWGVKNLPVYYASDTIEDTTSQVSGVMPVNDEIVNAIQPMFNSVLLMNYDLEPTEAEAESLLEEIFNNLFKVTTETSVEKCGQAITDGTGTVTTHSCGNVHALSDCPNPQIGTHDSFTCDECDSYYYTCNGHKGSLICTNSEHTHVEWTSKNSPGCYSTIVHDGKLEADCGNSTKSFQCSGYAYCNSHNVISYTLSLEGAYALEVKYFTDPIDQLASINPRTEEQEEQLQKLKDYYEIFQELMSQVSTEYGGGLTMSDLSGVNFINGTRISNQAVVDLALSQVGQQGGQPYWRYYGFQSRVAWCACFVNWCMRHTPSASSSYPSTSNNAYCQTIANHFMSIGQWGDRNFTNLVAGDTIFFDWEGDGHTDHIGIVIGQDGTYVYTVEGNSGDAVKIKQYKLGSSVIYGYGLMNY